MAYQFPANPTPGDTFDKFTWNGSSWALTAQGGGGSGNFDGLITDLYGPTVESDPIPTNYSLLVVDKDSGEVKTVKDYDYFTPE